MKFEMDFSDYIKVLKRRRTVALAAFAIIIFTSTIVSSFQPQYYQAQSKIIFREQEESKIFKGEAALFREPYYLNWVTDTQAEIIKSRPLAERVAEKLLAEGIELDPALIMSALEVEIIPDTSVIRISDKFLKPEIAVAVVNAIAENYVQGYAQESKEEVEGAYVFVKQQLVEYSQELKKAEEELQDFKTRNKIIDLDSETRANVDLVSRLELEREEARISQQEITSRIAEIEQKRELGAEQTGNFEADLKVDQLRTELVKLETSYYQAKQTAAADSPILADIRQKIEQIKKSLKSTQAQNNPASAAQLISGQQSKLNEDLLGLEIDSVVNAAKIKALNNLIKNKEESMLRLAPKDMEMVRLSRKVKLAEDIYNLFLGKEAELKVQTAIQSGNARIMELARQAVPLPKPLQRASGFIGILALLVGLGAAYLVEYFDSTIQTPEEIRRYLGSRVLGIIPKLKKTDKKLLFDCALKSNLAEDYNSISFHVETALMREQEARTVLVTSAIPGEGKSTIVSNLAISMAWRGERVILVDADLRHPILHRLFGVDNSLGLSNILLGEVAAEIKLKQLMQKQQLDEAEEEIRELELHQVLKETKVKGLRLLPSGPLIPNPVEVLKSEKMKELISELKQKASIIFFDCAPVTTVIDPVVLASHLDASLLVFEAGRVNRREVVHVFHSLKNLDIKVLGVILNAVTGSVQLTGGYYYNYYAQQQPKR